MSMQYQKLHRGFTLIETLIYIAVVGMTVTSLVLFTVSLSNSRTKTYVVQEVHANTRVALDTMERTIRNAESVEVASSTFGVDPGVLVLRMADPLKDPTVIQLDADDGALIISEGEGDAVSLTSSQAVVQNLVFTNLTASSSREHIRIEMTMGFKNLGDRVEYTYTQDVQTAVSVRK